MIVVSASAYSFKMLYIGSSKELIFANRGNYLLDTSMLLLKIGVALLVTYSDYFFLSKRKKNSYRQTYPILPVESTVLKSIAQL